MPVFEVEESAYTGPIPDNEILQAEVVGVKMVTKPWKEDDGSDVTKVEFSFIVRDQTSPYDGQRLWGETSTLFSNNINCKLRNWAMEILGTDLPIGTKLDTDTLINGFCRILVRQREYEKDGETKVRNYVGDVMRTADRMAPYQAEEEPF